MRNHGTLISALKVSYLRKQFQQMHVICNN